MPTDCIDGTILLTGAAGHLGSELLRQTPRSADLHALWRRSEPSWSPRHQVDLADREAVFACFDSVRPSQVIHTAYSGSDLERDTIAATQHVVEACLRISAHLVYMSTDAHLDGEHAPYAENAEPAPVYEYGEAKARAEYVVRERLPGAAVVRSSLIVGTKTPNRSSAWILDRLAAGESVGLFVDELRNPIAVEDLAAAIWELAALPAGAQGGVWHLAGPEAVSRYTLGILLALRAGYPPDLIEPKWSRESPTPRPRDLRLSTPRADAELTTRTRPISAVLLGPE